LPLLRRWLANYVVDEPPTSSSEQPTPGIDDEESRAKAGHQWPKEIL
jgi:hypothetical protein